MGGVKICVGESVWAMGDKGKIEDAKNGPCINVSSA